MQNQYNLLRRQDEPELMAMCADMRVGLVPYSPQSLRTYRRRNQTPSPHRGRARTRTHPHREEITALEKPYTNSGPSWF